VRRGVLPKTTNGQVFLKLFTYDRKTEKKARLDERKSWQNGKKVVELKRKSKVFCYKMIVFVTKKCIA
jgi:hypothetical protein